MAGASATTSTATPRFSIGAITGGHSHYLNQRSLQEVGRGSLVLMNGRGARLQSRR